MLDRFASWITKNNIQNVSIEQGDMLNLESLPHEWKDYDLIVTAGMLEYLLKHQTNKAFANFKHILKPNGTLIIFISQQNTIIGRLLEKRWKAHLYKKETLQQLLHNSGFSHVRFLRFPFPYNYLNFWGFIIEAKQ